MRSRLSAKSHTALFLLTALIVLSFLSLPVFAQEEPVETTDAETTERPAMLELDVEGEETVEPDEGRVMHPYYFSICGQFNLLTPVRVLKEEVYDINDLTKVGSGYGAGLTFHFTDDLAFNFKATRGGFNFVDNKTSQMQDINNLLDGNNPLTPDSYLQMDTMSFNVVTFLGGFIMPESRFNPYVLAGYLYTDWALHEGDRDTDPIAYQGKAIEGNDSGIHVGLGTAYRLNSKISLNASWTWTHIITGDEIKWVGFQSTFNKSFYWTNTQYWNLGLGLTINY